MAEQPSPVPSDLPRPYRETLFVTLRRTLLIGLGISLVLTPFMRDERALLDAWWRVYLAVLWFPLGGHYVELGYLNGWRMKSAWVRRQKYVSRVLYWIVGGLPLGAAFLWTLHVLGARFPLDLPLWWGMPFFPAVECVIHLVLTVLGRPSFWNARE